MAWASAAMSPRYYYGKAMEHYGVMNVMPYLIVTPHCAIQIASDRKAAIFHEDREVVAYLGEAFDKMYQQSRPLMTSMDGFGGRQAQWAMEYVKSADFSHTIEMCSGLCSIQFWDEGLIRKYMNPQAPGYASMIEEYIAYTAALYQAKKQGQVTVLMNGAFVEAFLQTGVFREYPAVFFAKPVSPGRPAGADPADLAGCGGRVVPYPHGAGGGVFPGIPLGGAHSPGEKPDAPILFPKLLPGFPI